MSSPIRLDNDIWFMVIEIVYGRTLKGSKDQISSARASLAALRLTNRFLAVTVAPYLLFHINVKRLDDASFERLKYLLKSSTTCDVVRIYQLRPKIATSRQGELSSPYHKIPPHLDYGRQSSSPIIQEENRKLKQAAREWEQQYRIIFPTRNKAAAALKGAFKYSRTGGEPGLKDSIYFKALDSFSNLLKLEIWYPPPEDSKLIKAVGNEYSIGLGRYLGKGPRSLETLVIKSITPRELVVLVQTMVQAGKQNVPVLPTTHLEITLITTTDYRKDSIHQSPEVGNSLATLLGAIPELKTLLVDYTVDIGGQNAYNFAHLAISPIRPPPLPHLKRLSLTRLAFAAEDLLALVIESPSRLNDLTLDSISLLTPSWATVFRQFATSETLEYFLAARNMKNMTYHNSAEGYLKSRETAEDRRALTEWEAKIDQRIVHSIGSLDFSHDGM